MPTTLPPPTVPDAELVRRFAVGRDEAAFELLVWRYRGLVADVCRRTLGHAHDAEDAAQAAFLVLARKAGRWRGDTLAPWLARVAHLCAMRVRRSRKPFAALPDVPGPSLPPDPLDTHLDAELDRLPEKYRRPIVLCYLHGLSYAQASERLRCPTGTLCGWLTRGKELLRKRLACRGVAVSAGAFAASLGGLGSASASHHQVREVTSAAIAFAAGVGTPDRSDAIAHGVLNMMSLERFPVPVVCALMAVILAVTALLAADPKKADDPKPLARADDRPDAERIQGVWLFDGYQMKNGSRLSEVWTSVVTIGDGTFGITKVYEADKPLTGKFTLDPAKKAIDLKADEFDLEPIGFPLKLPACTIPGVYTLDGDTLRIAFESEVNGQRPDGFEMKSKRDVVLTLRRAPKGFKEFPKEVAVKVLGPDGKPADGAFVAGFMRQEKQIEISVTKNAKPLVIDVLRAKADEVEKALEGVPKDSQLREYVKGVLHPPPGTVREPETGWTFYDTAPVGKGGVAKVKHEALRYHTLTARDTAKKLIGVKGVTPWALRTGEVVVQLQPECRVLVKGTCSEITLGGGKVEDHFNSYIQTADGARIGFAGSRTGDLEYLVPPGDYLLDVYGSEAMGGKHAAITVPKDQSEYTAPPVDLPATGMHKLFGKPAPELTDVVGWKGEPVKLADLKGKVVLLEFWGYWCGPCVASMPVLYELHDKFKDDGLVIVGIHVDAGGEVDTAKALDEKLSAFKKDVWKGRDLPFPSALVSGKRKENDARGELADRYGIRSYPSTILIDRDGRVVGKFHARDAKTAIAEMEKVLKAEKR